MRCEEVQEYLAERLAGSLSDRLSETVHTYVRTHMLSCPECCEELDDFEEMQSMLRSIPVEPCDSKAMRARFDLMMGAREARVSRKPATLLVMFAAIVALAGSILAVRQIMRWNSVVPVPPLASAQPDKPDIGLSVRTGAMSGQIRTSNRVAQEKVRVVVIAVPKPGTPALEIAVETSADGRYRLDNIPAGQYYVLASSIDSPTYYPGAPDLARAAVVTIRAGDVLEGIDFTRIVSDGVSAHPIASAEGAKISGRALLEDGSGISGPASPGEIEIRASDGPSNAAAIKVKLDTEGGFSQSFPAGEYRFRVAEFSQDYVIRSVAAGSTDLLKEHLRVTADSPAVVEIRVARRSATAPGRVNGTVLDAVTNDPAPVERVVLCCIASGSAERISSVVRSDGTFEFHGVPSGQYTAELRGSGNPALLNPDVAVTPAGVSILKLLSASKVTTIYVDVRRDTAERLPFNPDMSIVLSETTGTFRISASPYVGNLFRVTVPANSRYGVTVSNIARGYSIQSIVDINMTDLMHGGFFTPTSSKSASPGIVITLSKN